MSSIEKLKQIASTAISDKQPDLNWMHECDVSPKLTASYMQLMSEKNGFFCFESAFLVYPDTCVRNICGALEWNQEFNWLAHYGVCSTDYIVFAENVFSEQFVISKRGVERFNPEDGEFELIADSFESFADKLLDDFDVHTGWSVARDWQNENQPLKQGYRLIPSRPFILGGEYVSTEMKEIDMVSAMKKNISLYNQTRTTPDGASVTIKGWI